MNNFINYLQKCDLRTGIAGGDTFAAGIVAAKVILKRGFDSASLNETVTLMKEKGISKSFIRGFKVYFKNE